MNEIQIFNYEGNNVTFRNANGVAYVNLTEVSKSFPNKNLSKIVNSQEIKDYVNELSAITNVIPAHLLLVKNGGNDYGTWGQELVAIRVAQKLSTKFAIWVDIKIKELMTKGSVSLKTPQTFAEALRLAADQAEQIEQQQKLIEEQKPKVEFADAVLASENSIYIRDLALLISQNGYYIGEVNLYRWMRNFGYLCKEKYEWNKPKQKYIEMGIFEISETHYLKDGKIEISFTTKVTQKGVKYFLEKFILNK